MDRLDAGISKRPSRFDRKYHFALPAIPERIQYCEYWRLLPTTPSSCCAPCSYTHVDPSCRTTRLSDYPPTSLRQSLISPKVSALPISKKPLSPPCYPSFRPKERVMPKQLLWKCLKVDRMISDRTKYGKPLANKSKFYAKK